MSEEVAMMENEAQALERTDDPRRAEMKTPDDVTAMRRLKALGWGAKRIAAELGCSKTTVKDWLRRGEWRPCAKPLRSTKLDGLTEWLAVRFRQHAGNADVVRQELATEKGIYVSLRTVERAVAPLRQDLVAAARATVRFETSPGEQMQIDFGERRVTIGEEPTRVFLFVATLGYSRRLHVRAFGHERQEDWFAGLESAFQAFGGVPREVLLDNARALVLHHDPVSREVVFHPRLQAFAKHWSFRVRACAPYRARTKGKDERGVGYVKRNAVAGRSFASFAGLEAHLDAWTREGYLPFEPDAAHLFFQLVSRRYERGAMLLTSNRAVGEWGTVFGDAVVATAILDRLLHHSHVVTIRGDS
ncbi:hypothetical protein CS379_05830, partial [Methylobacterium frigidaeris]